MVTDLGLHIIIVAAGTGSRFGSAVPKQFCLLAGRPVVMHTIDALREALPAASMSLVISEPEHSRWNSLCERYSYDSPAVVYGGDSRYQSVKNAIAAMPEDVRLVMVHDGARPFPSQNMLRGLLDTLSADSAAHGVLPALAVTDSLRCLSTEGDGLSDAVDRSRFRAVQTPQLFPAEVICSAYAATEACSVFTDDASVVEHAGYRRILLSDGDVRNMKITSPGDLRLAEFLLADS